MNAFRRQVLVPLALCAALAAAVAGADNAPTPEPVAPERALADALTRVAGGDLDAALSELDALIAREPRFRLAHLVRGDVLRARAGALGGFGDVARGDAEALAELREEATLRLAALTPTPAESLPAALLRLAPGERHAIVVDTRAARVLVFANDGGVPRKVADFYASHGKLGAAKLKEGDKRTPTGAYRIAGWLPPESLTAFYGAGAFPISYPNALDVAAGRDGFGIWLHGSPRDLYARAPRASDGCVVLADDDLRALAGLVEGAGTPVVIEDGARWLEPEAWQAARGALEQAVESWRADWSSRDADAYLAHYAAGFRDDEGKDRVAWERHKRRVNGARRFIEVAVEDLSLQAAGPDAAVATFTQVYRSDTLSNSMVKRQYWVREDGAWRIAWEGAADNDRGRPLRTKGQLDRLAAAP